MKAVVFQEYGQADVLTVDDVPMPALKPEEVLVRNFASSVNFGDLLVRNLKDSPRSAFYMPSLFYYIARLMFGWSKPRMHILGSEFSGQVEAVGDQVKTFMPGDKVYGYTGPVMGTYAEFVKIREKGSIAKLPESFSYEEAAVLPYGVVVASSVLAKVDLAKGDKVLVVGASGGIGSAMVQLLKYKIGAEVTGVCSASRIDYVKTLGADYAIDYASEDFTQTDRRYDVIIDILGKSTFSDCKKVLTPHGKCVLVSFKARRLIQMWWSRLKGGPQLYCILGAEPPGVLEQWNALSATVNLHRSPSRVFLFTEAALAHRYAESSEKTGSTVLSFTATEIHGE